MRGRLLLVCLLTAGAIGLVAPGPAGASCAAPNDLTGAPVSARLGQAIGVEGSLFLDGVVCDDTPDGGGCSRDDRPEARPAQDVTLSLRQGTRTYALGTADADANGRIT